MQRDRSQQQTTTSRARRRGGRWCPDQRRRRAAPGCLRCRGQRGRRGLCREQQQQDQHHPAAGRAVTRPDCPARRPAERQVARPATGSPGTAGSGRFRCRRSPTRCGRSAAPAPRPRRANASPSSRAARRCRPAHQNHDAQWNSRVGASHTRIDRRTSRAIPPPCRDRHRRTRARLHGRLRERRGKPRVIALSSGRPAAAMRRVRVLLSGLGCLRSRLRQQGRGCGTRPRRLPPPRRWHWWPRPCRGPPRNRPGSGRRSTWCG